MRQKREAVLVNKSLIDVEAAIDKYAIAKSAAGIEAQGAHAAWGAIVEGVSFDAADLGGVDEFRGVKG